MTFPPKQSVADQTTDRAMLFGMALCSFSALLLELALTRVFSVVLFYHFAFLAISIALLGLGAGGVFAHLRKSQLARFETRDLVSGLCSINPLIVPVMLLIVLHIPVSLNISTANFLRLIAIYLSPTVPLNTQRGTSGDVKGTIRSDARYLVTPNDVRRHRLISISYISLLPCHGRGRGFESRRPRHSFQKS